jgi:putative DNA primase/helicase
MTTFEQFLETWEANGGKPKRKGRDYLGRCPCHYNHSHGDRTPSLSVTEKDGKVLANCFVGCSYDEIRKELGLEFKGVRTIEAEPLPAEKKTGAALTAAPVKDSDIEDIYPYVDENGFELYQVIRLRDKKGFPQRHRDPLEPEKWINSVKGVRKVPFRLPQVLKAVASNEPMFVVAEGEKDVKTLEAQGLTATTFSGGCWGDEAWDEWDLVSPFVGARIILLADRSLANNRTGLDNARFVANRLYPVAKEIRILEWPRMTMADGKLIKDATDFFGAGGTVEKLSALLRKARRFEPYGVVSRSAADTEPEPIAWAWDSRVPLGNLTLLGGEAKKNKSLLMVELVAQLTRGELDGHLKRKPSSCLFISAEDSWRSTTVPRLTVAEADRSKVLDARFNLDDFDTPISLPRDGAALERLIERHSAKLVVIDPLFAHLDAEIDYRSDPSIRRSLAPLAGIAERQECAIVGIAHFKKGEAASIMEKIGGSVGVTAAARSILVVAADPSAEDDESKDRVVVHAECNLALEASTLRFRPEGRTFLNRREEEISTVEAVMLGEAPEIRAEDILAPNSREKWSLLDEAKEWLQAQLANGPRYAKEITNMAYREGIPKDTLVKARIGLRVRSRPVGFGGARMMHLPDHYDRYLEIRESKSGSLSKPHAEEESPERPERLQSQDTRLSKTHAKKESHERPERLGNSSSSASSLSSVSSLFSQQGQSKDFGAALKKCRHCRTFDTFDPSGLCPRCLRDGVA